MYRVTEWEQSDSLKEFFSGDGIILYIDYSDGYANPDMGKKR